jgi:prepilin-type N-terminal cleavage/methylation domain-containing protein
VRLSTFFGDERGFTLQETVVVMIVSSILVGFSYILFQFVMHFVHTNLEAKEHREAVQHIAALICTDIERSRSAQVTDSCLILDRVPGRTVVYCTTKGKIVRNWAVITPLDSSIWTVQWQESSDSTDSFMRPITVSIKASWKRGTDSVYARETIPWSSKRAFESGTEGKNK